MRTWTNWAEDPPAQIWLKLWVTMGWDWEDLSFPVWKHSQFVLFLESGIPYWLLGILPRFVRFVLTFQKKKRKNWIICSDDFLVRMGLFWLGQIDSPFVWRYFWKCSFWPRGRKYLCLLNIQVCLDVLPRFIIKRKVLRQIHFIAKRNVFLPKTFHYQKNQIHLIKKNIFTKNILSQNVLHQIHLFIKRNVLHKIHFIAKEDEVPKVQKVPS